MRRTRSLLRRAAALTAAGSIALAAALVSASSANADTDQVGLPPDVPAYCTTHPPFALQVQEAGWKVSFDKVTGTHGANNWGCRYMVITKIPTGPNSFTLPVFHTESVDFRALCGWQYPGATTDWSTARDWTCIGKPGRSYGAQGLDGVSQYTDQ